MKLSYYKITSICFNSDLSLGPSYSYVIEKGVCYLVLCEASFPKKLAFAYLEDLQAEFHEQHGKKVPTVSRPYSFIEFGKNKIDLSELLLFMVKILSMLHFRSHYCFQMDTCSHSSSPVNYKIEYLLLVCIKVTAVH